MQNGIGFVESAQGDPLDEQGHAGQAEKDGEDEGIGGVQGGDGCLELGPGVGQGVKDGGHFLEQHGSAGLVEAEPCQEGTEHGEDPADPARDGQFFAEVKGEEHEAPQEAPQDEVPSGPVPDAGNDKDDHDGEGPGFGAAAAEGQVNVVAEPGAEGDMPAPPEFLGVAGDVGAGKVEGETDAQASGDSQSDEAVAGKVVVNAEAEDDVVEPDEEGVVHGAGVEMNGEVVGQADFEKEADHDPRGAAVDGDWVPAEAEGLHLGQKVFTSLDGACDNLGEEACEVHEVEEPWQRVLVDDGIDDESDDLEGIKGKADRDDEAGEACDALPQDVVHYEVAIFVV